jgi:hypothetical protein
LYFKVPRKIRSNSKLPLFSRVDFGLLSQCAYKEQYVMLKHAFLTDIDLLGFLFIESTYRKLLFINKPRITVVYDYELIIIYNSLMIRTHSYLRRLN